MKHSSREKRSWTESLFKNFNIEVRFGVLVVKQSSCQWVKPLNLSKRTFLCQLGWHRGIHPSLFRDGFFILPKKLKGDK
jgi:hypothetical protein